MWCRSCSPKNVSSLNGTSRVLSVAMGAISNEPSKFSGPSHALGDRTFLHFFFFEMLFKLLQRLADKFLEERLLKWEFHIRALGWTTRSSRLVEAVLPAYGSSAPERSDARLRLT